MNDQTQLAASMCQEAANVALAAIGTEDEDALKFLDRARVLVHDMQIMMRMAAGEQQDFDKSLGPLARAIDDFIMSVDVRLALEIDLNKQFEGDAFDESEVDGIIAARESGQRWLDQARITGVLLLAHLSQAIKPLGNSTTV